MTTQIDKLTVGVLALQGDFERHQYRIRSLGARERIVRLPEQLEGVDALVMPGGESTTMERLIDRFGLRQPLIEFGRKRPIWGTCAGMILLGTGIEDNQANVKPLGLMDIDTHRNYYGRQVYSFNMPLTARLDSGEVTLAATFIRAPRVVRCGREVEILAVYEGDPVLVAEGNLLASSFHTELDEDMTLLEFFLKNYC